MYLYVTCEDIYNVLLIDSDYDWHVIMVMVWMIYSLTVNDCQRKVLIKDCLIPFVSMTHYKYCNKKFLQHTIKIIVQFVEMKVTKDLNVNLLILES